MREYENIEITILLEMLSEETERLTRLMSQHNFDYEYFNCKRMIHQLTEEIAVRSRPMINNPDSMSARPE